ncbi:exopolygalacturonase-like [Cucurbita pepo subsp. pepo]|uniref:exopolygalacturonase-like n=1 Tax=Cucurbita pepo subsp. pepo TaxID=3664 RepID=UPI000C9D5A43|nr:exopolygalacturonase-like [Cucurbita pepo subsp. pepo]
MGLNSSPIECLVFIAILLCITKCYAQNVFNIMQFGARNDGRTDSTQALSKAWSEACSHDGGGVVLVPDGRFLIFSLVLKGPCKGSIGLRINGELLAPIDPNFAIGQIWLSIYEVDNLFVDGYGSLNGRGSLAWSIKKFNRPISMKLSKINHARITGITSYNSKNFHFSVHGCNDVTFDHIRTMAPKDSPNTDGIHISKSSGINIMHSRFDTGDDCISLGPGSRFINITNIYCGPGHGISIGSLGKYPNEEDVSDVIVRDSTFVGTDNGVRIKTWSSSLPSSVTKITFLNLEMKDVKNPIVIDQNYCLDCQRDQMSNSRVKIRDVRYENIRGTSATQVAVNFECSHVLPCEDIVLGNINLPFKGAGQPTSICNNVKGHAFGKQFPNSCL